MCFHLLSCGLSSYLNHGHPSARMLLWAHINSFNSQNDSVELCFAFFVCVCVCLGLNGRLRMLDKEPIHWAGRVLVDEADRKRS